MKSTYKVIATVKGMREPFVDWYEADNEDDAKQQWETEAKIYGLPLNETTIEIRLTQKSAQ